MRGTSTCVHVCPMQCGVGDPLSVWCMCGECVVQVICRVCGVCVGSVCTLGSCAWKIEIFIINYWERQLINGHVITAPSLLENK